MKPIGKTRWAIAEGHIPSDDPDKPRRLISHEACCILNAGDEDALITITLFFTDRPPAGPYRMTVGKARTLHVRFNDLRDPEPIPEDTDYASVIESNTPIVVQHTRLDGRKGVRGLLSTIAFSE